MPSHVVADHGKDRLSSLAHIDTNFKNRHVHSPPSSSNEAGHIANGLQRMHSLHGSTNRPKPPVLNTGICILSVLPMRQVPAMSAAGRLSCGARLVAVMGTSKLPPSVCTSEESLKSPTNQGRSERERTRPCQGPRVLENALGTLEVIYGSTWRRVGDSAARAD